MNTPVKVFSYRRFSSGRQARGTSLERQTKLAQAWCIERGLTLDESISLSDLGISAFKGDNATRGALGAFISAVDEGRIPRGSILLLESLDRLSRATLPEAISLLMQIVGKGIRVVSMVDGKEWNEETIQDSLSFMLSVLLFSRAHEESSTKAKRVSAAFQSKRKAGLPVVSVLHGGGWMKPRDDRSGWELIPDKADSVRKVFEHAAAGKGGCAIARLANDEGWALPWRIRKNTNIRWEHTQVSRILRDRRTIREWQPKRMINGNFLPDGEPVQDYFPAVVSEEMWLKVQAALSSRTGPKRIRGIHADIFAGLLKCSCGERLERKAISERGNARYYCIGRKAGISKCDTISERAIVETFFKCLGKYKEEHFRDDSLAESIREEIRIAEEKRKDAEERAERIMQAIEEGVTSALLSTRLRDVETVIERAKEDAADARIRLAAVPTIGAGFGENLAERAIAIVEDKSAVEERFKLASMIKDLVTSLSILTGGLLIGFADNQGFWYKFEKHMLERAPYARRKKEELSRRM